MGQVLKILKDEFKLAMMLSGEGHLLVSSGGHLLGDWNANSYPMFVFLFCLQAVQSCQISDLNLLSTSPITTHPNQCYEIKFERVCDLSF